MFTHLYLRLYGITLWTFQIFKDETRGRPICGILFRINNIGCIKHQLWSTGLNEKQLNGIDPTTHRATSERSTTELRPARPRK